MDQRGFSNPYIDDSGNGYRLAYKLNIPISNHGEIDAKLKAFFAEIKREFSYLDNISDLPRIIKVAGSMNLKGEDTPERPHRISKLIQVGDLKPNIKLQNYIQENKIGETAPTLSDTTKKVELDPNKIKQLRPCMQHFLMNGGRFIAKGDRNAETGARKSFYAEMIEANFSQAEILTASSGFDDFNPVKCQRELDKLYVTKRQEGALKPWKCETLQQHSICIGDECGFYVKRAGDYHEKEHGTTAPVVLDHINMIEDPNLAGKPISVEAVVSSTSIAYLIPKHVAVDVEDKDHNFQHLEREFDAKDPMNVQLVGVNEGTKQLRLNSRLRSGKSYVQDIAHRSGYRIRVRPPVFTLEKKGEKIVDEKGFE
ncbi:MAG TPA: hypothetical protein VMW84_04075, partial [Acidobacteriota bacterium]|nr:hypothetical protein [Acidobacteriota bacterium]